MLHLNSLFQLLETWVLLIRQEKMEEISQREKIHGRPWICDKFHITVVSWIFFGPLKGRKKQFNVRSWEGLGMGEFFESCCITTKLTKRRSKKKPKTLERWKSEWTKVTLHIDRVIGVTQPFPIWRVLTCHHFFLPWTDRPLGFKLWESAAEGFMWKSSSETTMALKRNVTKLVGGLREFSPHLFLATWKKGEQKKVGCKVCRREVLWLFLSIMPKVCAMTG